MDFRNFLLEEKAFIFIDPGFNTTGISIFNSKYDRKTRQFNNTLIHYRYIDISKNKSYTDSLFFVNSTINGLVNEFDVSFMFVEIPPQTIYNMKKLSKDGIVARAQSVFKVFAISFGIIGHFQNKVKHIGTVLPEEWQLTKRKRGGMGTKEWSLSLANRIYSVNLKTKREENVADAIMIGHFTLERLHKNERQI